MADTLDYENVTVKWVAVQRTGSHASNVTSKIIDKMFAAIKKEMDVTSSEAALIKAANNIIKEYSAILTKELSSGLKKVAQAMIDNELKVVAELTGSKKKDIKVTDNRVNTWIVKEPLSSGNVTVKNLAVSSITSAKDQVTNTIRTAKATDKSTGWMRNQLIPVREQLKKRFDMVSRTAVNKTANSAKELVYENYGANIDRVMWMSTLDHRTSPFCQLADGKVFRINEGPRPPAHPACRSVVVPVAKGESAAGVRKKLLPRPAVEPKSLDALEKKGLTTKVRLDEDGNKISGGRKRKPSRRDSSPLKGTTARNTTYETWMRGQGDTAKGRLYQEKVLGKNAAKRLRSGESLSEILKDTRSSIDFDSLGEALAA